MRETSRLVAALPGARVARVAPAARSTRSPATRARSGRARCSSRCAASATTATTSWRDAFARGAAAVVVERERRVRGVPAIVVADTRAAASKLAAAFYDYPSRDLIVAGVTGTNGKTTTTHLVRAALEAAGMPCAVIGTLGGAFGERRWPLGNTTPLALELQALLADACATPARGRSRWRSPRTRWRSAGSRTSPSTSAALTNITRDHLDFHGTMERYVAAKRHLFDLAPPQVLNVDDPAGRASRPSCPPRCATPSTPRSTTARAGCARPRCGSTATARRFRVGARRVRAQPGRALQRAQRPGGAGHRARRWASRRRTCVRGFAAMRAVPGRMERIGAFGIDAIVDYAHTPDALENVLRAARETARAAADRGVRLRRRPRSRQARARWARSRAGWPTG